MSRSAMAVKMLVSSGTARVEGTNAGYRSSPMFRSAMAESPLRSSGPGDRYTARVSMPSSVTSLSSTSADIVSSTSSRTAGSNLRRTSSRSIACSRFSVMSSSTSRSLILVTRNA